MGKITFQGPNNQKILIEILPFFPPEELKQLNGADFFLDRMEMESLSEGEWYVGDLLGMAVHAEDNTFLGKIIDFYPVGEGTNFVVQQEDKTRWDLCMEGPWIKRIDWEAKKVIAEKLELV